MLLAAVSAPQAEDVNRMKLELRRLVFDEQVRGEKRKSPRGYMVQDWEVNALPARLCKGLGEELVAELTEAHRLAKEAQPSDEGLEDGGDDEAPF